MHMIHFIGAERRTSMPAWVRKASAMLGVVGALLLFGVPFGGDMGTASAQEKRSRKPRIWFDMVRSGAAEAGKCLPDARAEVRVTSLGPVEEMEVYVKGLPANTDFDFFVLQVPNAPFGLAWYQGDIETDERGEGRQRFLGRFNIETFIVAQPPANQPAPVVHNQSPFPDAATNPATEPAHTYHLGLWFNSPQDAVKAGCPGATTRFNGEHNAGIQVLSTRNFGDAEGPLRKLNP